MRRLYQAAVFNSKSNPKTCLPAQHQMSVCLIYLQLILLPTGKTFYFKIGLNMLFKISIYF